ncbi:YdcF family protein [Limnoraphis robusta]|uniref:YdcF family protein n=2 Tax=Limnoraphis TaxID=1332112 RepID=A0ABU5TZZ1_9CYAN|nr:YdcF family protein [Limnoraphis robusta]MEA5519448.1 YdcF family protein [Limnoraphis robusta CCNP1315]
MFSLFNCKKLQKLHLVQRQEIWTLTLKGWVLTLLFLMTMTLISFFNLYPFLAVNAAIQADALVIEGWMPDYAIKAALVEFEKGSYQKIITTGVPLSKGYYLAEYKDFANLTAATFIKLGLDETQVIAVPASKTLRNRTDATAIALRDWLQTSDLNIKSINLFSLGPHARRSWMIFKKSLYPEIEVGIVSIKSEDYNAEKWWLSSEGFRTVISEFIAYFYVLFVQ